MVIQRCRKCNGYIYGISLLPHFYSILFWPFQRPNLKVYWHKQHKSICHILPPPIPIYQYTHAHFDRWCFQLLGSLFIEGGNHLKAAALDSTLSSCFDPHRVPFIEHLQDFTPQWNGISLEQLNILPVTSQLNIWWGGGKADWHHWLLRNYSENARGNSPCFSND